MNTNAVKSNSSERALVALFFILALLLRALFRVEASELEFFQILGLDSRFYHDWAMSLAGGTFASDEPFFQGPLYPYFLSGLYRTFAASVATAQWSQAILGALSTALVVSTTWRVFENRAAAISAGLMLGTYGYLMFLEMHVVAAPLLVFLFSLSLWLLVRLTQQPTMWRALPLGLVVGFLALGRGVALVMLALGIVASLVAARQQRKTVLRASGFVLLGTIVALLPTTIFNAQRGGGLTPVSTNGGINYYIGNHDGASGAFDNISGIEFFQPGVGQDGGSVALAARLSGRNLNPTEASRYWLGEGLRWNAANPGTTVALYGKKLLMLMSNFEIPQIENYDWGREESRWLRWSPVRFGWMMALALVGTVLLWHRRPSRWIVLAMVTYLIGLLPFFATGRFRAVVVPAVVILAAGTIGRLWELLQQRDMQRVATTVAAATALAVGLGLYAPSGIQASSEMLRFYSRGVVAMEAGKSGDAIEAFRLALEKNPEHVPSLANMAFCFSQQERHEESLKMYSAALAVDPSATHLLGFMLQAALADNNDIAARATLDRVLEVDPNSYPAIAQLGDLEMRAGNFEAARMHWMRILREVQGGPLQEMAQERIQSLSGN